jgi:hypothetical protein
VLNELVLELTIGSLIVPVLAELFTVIVTTLFLVKETKELSLVHKVSRYIIGVLFFVVASIGIFVSFIWNDISSELRLSLGDQIMVQLHLKQEYFYSVENNVVKATEKTIVDQIILHPDKEHMIFNTKDQNWYSWDTYPQISSKVLAYKQH